MADKRSDRSSNQPPMWKRSHKHHLSLTSAPSQRLSPPDLRPLQSPPRDLGTTIKVAARIRPKNSLEEVLPTQQLEYSKPDAVQCLSPTSLAYGDSKELVTLDYVFPPEATQKEVFESIGLPMVEDVLKGYNGTIFSYGQTGTGKTYSMMGVSIYDEEKRGIIPRAALELFARVEQSDTDVEFTFKCSMVEIYKERLKDLLNPEDVPLRIKEDPHRGIFVSGLKQICVSNEVELIEVIDLGEQMRTVAATQWNAVSSRSHQLFMLEVKQAFSNDTEKRGILNLVDLAGSEKVTYYGVTGNKLQETKKINLSLSALGNVIHSLTTNSEHIPYRDSKLTRLLQESLGGNFKTAILVALSPSYRFLDESINSIKFAQRAKRIKNLARVNIKESADTYIATIARLKEELAEAHREIHFLRSEKSRIPSPVPDVSYQSSAGSPFAISLHPCDEDSVRKEKPIRRNSQQFDVRLTSTADESLSHSPESDSLGMSFLLSKTRSILDPSVSLLHTEEVQKIASLYDEQIKGKTAKIEKLECELETLKSQVEDLDTQLASVKCKLVKSEATAHEFLEESSKLQQKNLELSEQIEYFKSKSSSSSSLIKELRQQLASLEVKCSEISSISSTTPDPTNLEFTDYQERDVSDQSQHEDLAFAFSAVKKPLSMLSDSKYTEKLRGVLAHNSYLSQEMTSFSLNSGLIAANVVNCSLSAVVHSLAWKTSIWKQKYELSKLKQVYQQNTIHGLENIIDSLYDSFKHVKTRIDKLDVEPIRRQMFGDGKSVIMRQVLRSREKKPVDSAGREVEKSLQSDRPRTLTSFFEGESLLDNRQKSYEMALNLQKAYNQQIKQTMEETQAEAYQYLKLIQSMEKGVALDQQHERKAWVKCITHLKETYEKELIRKHAEVIRLHEELGMWAQRFADSQGSGEGRAMASKELGELMKGRQKLDEYVPSKGLKDAISRAETIQKKLSGIPTLILARSGDSPPSTEFDEDS